MPFENLDPAGLISDFTGADENPLSEGGNWATLNTAVATRGLQRVSNAVAAQAGSACFAYWTPANFGPDLEAYVTLSTQAGNIGIAARIQGEGGSNTWDGYVVYANLATNYVIGRYDDGAITILTNPAQTWASGDKVGMRIEGSTIQIWRQASGSGDWNLLGSAVDATYSSAGKIGLLSSLTTARVDDFYAASGGTAAIPLVTA